MNLSFKTIIGVIAKNKSKTNTENLVYEGLPKSAKVKKERFVAINAKNKFHDDNWNIYRITGIPDDVESRIFEEKKASMCKSVRWFLVKDGK